MKTTPTIRIELALPPAQVLEQLMRYGKDWRESRLPPEARGVRFSLKVRDRSFELRLLGNGELTWLGSVVDSGDGGGSVLTAAPQPIRTSAIGWLLMIPASAGLLMLRGLSAESALVLSLVVLALVQALETLSRPGFARGEAPLCRAILLRAMQATPAGSSD